MYNEAYNNKNMKKKEVWVSAFFNKKSLIIQKEVWQSFQKPTKSRLACWNVMVNIKLEDK